MKTFLSLALVAILGGCSVHRPDGSCTAYGVLARPDRCGTAQMRREWESVGGFDGWPNRVCSSVARRLEFHDPEHARWVGLLIADSHDPHHLVCVPWREQVFAPAGGGR